MPGFGDAMKTLNSDISNQVNGQFAAAGRDLSGMNTQTLARGGRSIFFGKAFCEEDGSPGQARR